VVVCLGLELAAEVELERLVDALGAWWRMRTWATSWPRTPASSSTLEAASSVPLCT
jgi:hypothetical protein